MSKRNNILSAIKAIDAKVVKLNYRRQQLEAQLRELDRQTPSTGRSFARRTVKSVPSVQNEFDSNLRKDSDFERDVLDLMRTAFGDNEEWNVSKLPSYARASWSQEQVAVATAVADNHNQFRGLGGQPRV